MGNNVSSCNILLDRDVYYPGATLNGKVRIVAEDTVDFYYINVAITGSVLMGFEYSDGEGAVGQTTKMFSRTVITVAGDAESASSKNAYALLKGEREFPFSVVLSPGTLPSGGVTCHDYKRFKIFWEVSAVINVAGRLNEGGKKQLWISSPTPAQIWSQPSAKQESYSESVSSCWCFGSGEIGARCSISKTLVALDRDTIDWTLNVDLSDSKEDVIEVNAFCVVTCVPKVLPREAAPMSPSKIYFKKTVNNVNIPAGKTGKIEGRTQLDANAPASLSSRVCDFSWSFEIELTSGGCCTNNPKISIPIFCYHFVINNDQSATTQHQNIQQQQQSFQPIWNGQIVVPNMAVQNSPTIGQLTSSAHSPPPGTNYQYNNHNNNSNGHQHPPMANMASGVPPVHHGGFPEIATTVPAESEQNAQPKKL